MEEEKIDRILKLVNMLEVTDENREDIAKIKQLINEKKYNEMLLLVKKVTSKRENNEEKKKISIIEENENLNKNNAFGTNNSIREEEIKERTRLEKVAEKVSEKKEDTDYEYPRQLEDKQLEEDYISLLLANPKAISTYYIEKKDCYFQSILLLNIYKSILFTEGEAYAPQIAKDDFNYGKEDYEVLSAKKKLTQKGKDSKLDIEKVYVKIRKLFEIRKGYTANPLKETQKQIEEIINYELYDKMTIQEIKDAIVQITTTEKFKRSVLSTNITSFLLSGENNLNSGLSLPFPILSSVFKGIRKGETMSYAMPSNSGKSRFTIDLSAYIAYKHKKKVLIVSNEMSEEKMKLCLITTIVNNKEIQKLHGHKLRITEGEILEFKYRPDNDKNVEIDENGYVLRKENESLEEFSKRLEECSTQFKEVLAVTDWIQEQKENQIFFVNITDHTNDELEKIILNYYYKEKIEYMFYDTLKPDTENIGNSEELKKTATILSNLAQNLNIFIGSSLQLTESNKSPLNLDVNDLAACRTVKEFLDTLCLIKQIHKEDLDLYEYSKEEVSTETFELEKSQDPDVRYYACVVDKNRAGAKPKVVFRLNLAYNEWEELGYIRLKNQI